MSFPMFTLLLFQFCHHYLCPDIAYGSYTEQKTENVGFAPGSITNCFCNHVHIAICETSISSPVKQWGCPLPAGPLAPQEEAFPERRPISLPGTLLITRFAARVTSDRSATTAGRKTREQDPQGGGGGETARQTISQCRSPAKKEQGE